MRPSWSGFQFPTQFPFESIGGRLNQIGESAMHLDVGLTVIPGLTFPAEFPLEFVASSAALSVTVDVTGKTETDSVLVDAGIQRSELANMRLDVGVSRFELSPLIIVVWIPYEPGVAILDRYRQIRAILPGCHWNYSRRLNEATELSVYIPRQVVTDNIPAGHDLAGFFRENKTQYAEIAAFVQVFAGGKLKASGKINRRTLGDLVTIQAYTEEILLESNLTPAQYGMVWDGWDLADVARDLLDGWQSIRIKDQSQWQSYMVDSSNIDLTTDPGHVMLAKRSNGRYYESGHITLAFGAGEIVNFKRWDRIRWSADSEDPVKTTIQYSTDGANWSQEFDGGLPEEIGLVPNFGTQDTVYVRVNLYTSDTESEDPDGNPVGVTPTVFAVELIARTEGDLVAGTIPDVAGVTVKGIDADHASAFQVLLAACEQNGWEFQVINGALSIAENLGIDRTNDFVLRGGTNMEITSLGDEDEELVNVLTAYGRGRGINRLEITLRDDASIAQYGEYPAAVEFDANTLAELQAKAQEYLDTHNTPAVAFEVFAAFDHEHEPEYGLGDIVRVADPDTGIVTTARIMSESREFNENGLSVHLALGKAGLNLQSVLEGKERPTKPLDPLTPTGVYARGIIKGIVVGCSAPKTSWDYTECHMSTAKGFVPGSATLVDKGKQTRFDVPNLDPGVRYYARLIHVDTSGRRSEPSREVSAAAQYIPVEALPDYSIGVEKFMQDIKPPIMVSSLPVLPDPRYPKDTIVFLTTNQRLYASTGNDWEQVTVTDFSELQGELQSNQIALGAITEDLIAASAITKTKIADGSIETPKLSAGAITAEKIATGAVTANKINAGAITAEKIAAGAINAEKVAAGAITTEKLSANAVTADMVMAGIVAAGGITADYIKSGEISYDKLNVAFAQVDDTLIARRNIGGDISAVIEHVASDQNDWNVIKLSLTNIKSFHLVFYHNALNTLIGLVEVQWSANGFSWMNFGMSVADSYESGLSLGLSYSPLKMLTHQTMALLPDQIRTSQYIWTEGDRVLIGHSGDIWVRIRRHSIA